jgi:hypothetical protein
LWRILLSLDDKKLLVEPVKLLADPLSMPLVEPSCVEDIT